MKKAQIKSKFMSFVQILEIIIALMVIGAAIIAMIHLFYELLLYANDPKNPDGFSNFLEVSFNVIVGLEFLKMIIKQTPGSVVEVLLFAISRQMIVYHASTLESFFGVLAIAVLFLVYRYLLVGSANEPFSPMRTADRDDSSDK